MPARIELGKDIDEPQEFVLRHGGVAVAPGANRLLRRLQPPNKLTHAELLLDYLERPRNERTCGQTFHRRAIYRTPCVSAIGRRPTNASKKATRQLNGRILSVGETMIFRTLPQEEYDRLTADQKLEYLQRLMEDIGEKAMQVRKTIIESKPPERPK